MILFPPLIPFILSTPPVESQGYHEMTPLDGCDKFKWRTCSTDADCEYAIWKDSTFMGPGSYAYAWENSGHAHFTAYECLSPMRDISSTAFPGCLARRCVPKKESGHDCALASDCYPGDTCNPGGKCVACPHDVTPDYAAGACSQPETPGNDDGVPSFEEDESGCAGDHCRNVCPYDTMCFRIDEDTTEVDLTATHNALAGVFAVTDEMRAHLMRPSTCGGTDAGKIPFPDYKSGMRCAGYIHRYVTGFQRTPDALRGRDLDVVELEINNNWEKYVRVDPHELETLSLAQEGGGTYGVRKISIGSVVPTSDLKVTGTSKILGKGAYAYGLTNWHWGIAGLVNCEVRYDTDAPLHTPWWGIEVDTAPTRETLLTRACIRWRDKGPTVLTFVDPDTGETVEFGEKDMWCGEWGVASSVPYLPFGGRCTLIGPNVREVIPDAEQRQLIKDGLKKNLRSALADLLRIAFHDAATYTIDTAYTRGGSLGCMRFEHIHGGAGNAGIQFTIDRISPAVNCGTMFGNCPWSMADMLQFAGAYAVQEMDGPDMMDKIRWGRTDAPYMFCTGESQLLQPDFNGGHKAGLMEVGSSGGTSPLARLEVTLGAAATYFEGTLGLAPELWVALLGAHTVGGARGLNGPARNQKFMFDDTPEIFDNEYYQRLLLASASGLSTLCPQMRNLAEAHWWEPGKGWKSNNNNHWLILLDTDVSMITNSTTLELVKLYATDLDAFHSRFEQVYVIVSELGHDGNLFDVPNTPPPSLSPSVSSSPSTPRPSSVPTRTTGPSDRPSVSPSKSPSSPTADPTGFPTRAPNENYTYLGCYKDKAAPDRALPHHRTPNGGVEDCSKMCIDFKYFGRQYIGECWCGNTGYDRHGEAPGGCDCHGDMVGDWTNCVHENNLFGGTDGPSVSSPTSDVPSSSSSVASSGAPSSIPSAETSSSPTDLPSPVPSLKDLCANLKKSKCKTKCVWGPKKVKACLVKKQKFEHDCAQYTQRTPCREVEFCKFANGRCFHKCDGLGKKKCIKAHFCKPAKITNPCLGCQLVTTCGPIR